MIRSPFEILNSILSNKRYLMDEPDSEKSYNPFFINRGLSQHIDCLLYANEMNKYNQLDSRLQYDYYFHSLKRMKRSFGKWAKKENNDLLLAICKYYGIGYQKAKEYEGLLNDEQKTIIVSQSGLQNKDS